MILFLDFDGVLHPIPCQDRNLLVFIPRLEGVLRDFPDVRVVISSLWRASHDLDGLRAYFSEDIRPRIIDTTPFTDVPAYADSMTFIIGKVRHAEILQWMEENDYQGPYVCLDDAWREFPNPCAELIRCETEIGFDNGIEQKLREYLLQFLKR